MHSCGYARHTLNLLRFAAGDTVVVVASTGACPIHAASRDHSPAAPTGGGADASRPPALSALHMSVEPGAPVSEFDMQSLKQQFVQQLPGLVARLGDKPAHVGEYEAYVHVVSVAPIVELLEPGPAADDLVQRGLRTIRHGLRF
jgi:hypothetical protein